MEYHFGWRPSPPDQRDAKYAFVARRETLEALPPSIDLSDDTHAGPWEPVWQQGEIGSCGPNSAAADIVFSALRQQMLPAVSMPSRLFIYWTTRSLMNTVESDSGVDNRSLLKALVRYGWCDEELWPYQTSKFRTQPHEAAFTQAATRKIVEYQSVPQVIEQMKGCLAQGDTFIFGFTVYQSMMSAAVERSGIVPMPKLLEQPVGGHDVLIVGYDDATRRFKFRNSWGPNWGANGGYGFLPYEYAINPQLATDFWTIKRPSLPMPAPPIPPQPTPTPGHHVVAIAGPISSISVDGKLINLNP